MLSSRACCYADVSHLLTTYRIPAPATCLAWPSSTQVFGVMARLSEGPVQDDGTEEEGVNLQAGSRWEEGSTQMAQPTQHARNAAAQSMPAATINAAGAMHGHGISRRCAACQFDRHARSAALPLGHVLAPAPFLPSLLGGAEGVLHAMQGLGQLAERSRSRQVVQAGSVQEV